MAYTCEARKEDLGYTLPAIATPLRFRLLYSFTLNGKVILY